MYKQIFRPWLFNMDPEEAHHLTLNSFKNAIKVPGMGPILRSMYAKDTPKLSKQMFGLHFKNPVGLAAGLDKDAFVGDAWKYMGFGFVELGTVTPKPQTGNPKKRLFRLPTDQALINRMGFNNEGVEAMAKRLSNMDKGDMIIGANIGKNKVTPNEEAVKDYEICFDRLHDLVDYFVVNVSSPNTPGLRSLQEREPLTRILLTLQEMNAGKSVQRPLLLKIAPDLNESQIDDIVAVAADAKLDGLIATNTTISRAGLQTPKEEVDHIGAGGLSGKPLTERAQEVTKMLAEKTDGSLPLVGVGGIMTPQDASERLDAGASLVQIYSGFIYQGPAFVKEILEHLETYS
ncbi:quinone-dependent dihydroorotate dehydrogenase [Pontibacter sp. G13]|uniref:quinone-dependent dihydroorotate dehydrogenase n=1 Tax=Pontibacter sp. G13 TaxID=3074898 RepID=UPI002889A74C|nr:quinone-dependent dihydroorotate dehydrogenase [Pontibacter sp. G13]WNJ20782.1 quinone-dependent dihydroorotate dehydrogenase [Pontibacter sp. G13]